MAPHVACMATALRARLGRVVRPAARRYADAAASGLGYSGHSTIVGGGGYKKVLLVFKTTPYEMYTQLKNQGQAPKALRWERLHDRHESHMQCVEDVRKLIEAENVDVSVVSRNDLGRHHLEDVDLLVAVGGDGTVLSASHYVDSLRRAHQPWLIGPVVIGINSDPTKPHEFLKQSQRHVDERRSYGALCFTSVTDMKNVVPKAVRGELDSYIQLRHRMAVTIRGTLSEQRLPPALNDVLVAHPSPASVSRFRLERRHSHPDAEPGLPPSPDFEARRNISEDDEFSFNVWSSGLWVSTATGATAAISSAGGNADVDFLSPDLQYLVREHLIGETDDISFVKSKSHGIVDRSHHLLLRWNSQHGSVWIDGQHTQFKLELGDEIFISAHAMPLRLFSAWQTRPRGAL